MLETSIFSLLEDNYNVRGVLTSVTLGNSSLSEVPMTLLLHEESVAIIHQNGSVFSNLPAERFLALGLQVTSYQTLVDDRDGAKIPPAIHDMAAFLPLSGLPVPVESAEFTDFWGFLAQSVGQKICWDGDDYSISVSVLGAEDKVIRSFTLASRTAPQPA